MRLVHALKAGAVVLSHVQWLVLDEADRMFENGFEHQVRRERQKERKRM